MLQRARIEKTTAEQAARTDSGVVVTPFATLRGLWFRVNANSAPTAGFPPRSTPCGSAARYTGSAMNGFHLFINIVLSIIGTGYFITGKKRGNMRVLACGLALGIFPYFVENYFLLFIVGIILILIPYVFRNN